MLKTILADKDRALLERMEMDVDWGELGLEIVGKCDGAESTLIQAGVLLSEIVLMGATLLEGEGVQYARKLRKQAPGCAIILLVDEKEFEHAYQGIRMEVADILVKPLDKKQLKQAIGRVSRQYLLTHLPKNVMRLVWSTNAENIRKELFADNLAGYCVRQVCGNLVSMIDAGKETAARRELEYCLNRMEGWDLSEDQAYWIYVFLAVLCLVLIRDHGGTVPLRFQTERGICSYVCLAQKEGYIRELLKELCIIAVSEKPSRTQSRAQYNVRKAMDIIRQNFKDSQFSVTTLADIMYMHEGHLRRIFKAQCGKTPHRVLKEMRLQEARRLLAEGNIQVQEAALQVGYEDTSYFSKCFKKQFGYSPCRIPVEG